MGTRRSTGIGNQIKIPVMLKKRWQKATCNAAANFPLELAKAASRPVAVVPMFEPRVSGYIRFSEMIPMPTRGVSAEVNIELLCKIKVNSAPIKIVTYPVRKESFPGNLASTVLRTTMASRPFRAQCRSLTMRIRQTHKVRRETTSRMAPTAASDRLLCPNIWWPMKR